MGLRLLYLPKDYQYSCVLEGEGIVGHPVPT